MDFLTASVKVVIDDSNVAAKLSSVRSQVAREVERMQANFNRINMRRLIAEITIALTAITDITRRCLEAAGGAAEIHNAFDRIFNGLSVQARKWSDQFAEDIGRARISVEQWLSSFQLTYQVLGMAREKAFEFSKALVEAALNVALLKGKLDIEVIRDFQSGIIGNVRAVRQYGIAISEAAMRQEMFNLKWRQSFDSLSELQKAQLRTNIVIRSAKYAAGEAQDAMTRWAGQVLTLQGRFTNLKIAIGERILPLFIGLLKQLNEYLKVNEKLMAQQIGAALLKFWEGIVNVVVWLKEHYFWIRNTVVVLASLYTAYKVTQLVHKFSIETMAVVSVCRTLYASLVGAVGLISGFTLLGGALLILPIAYTVYRISQLLSCVQELDEALRNAAKAKEKYNILFDVKLVDKFLAGESKLKDKTTELAKAIKDYGEKGKWWASATRESMLGELEIEKKRVALGTGLGSRKELLAFELRMYKEKLDAFDKAELDMRSASVETFDDAKMNMLRAYSELVKQNLKLKEANKAFVLDTTEGNAVMYGILRGHDKEYTAAKHMQLEYQAAAYRGFGIKEQDIDEWLLQEHTKVLNELAIKSNDFFAGFQAGVNQMKLDIITWGQIGASVTKQVSSSMSDSLYSMLADGAHFRDAMRGFFLDILKSFLKMQTDMISQKATTSWIGPIVSALTSGVSRIFNPPATTGGTFTASEYHRGTNFAGMASSSRELPISLFDNAPRFHLGSREVPSILEKGERVIPKGGSDGNNVVVNFIDQTTEKHTIKQESFKQEDQYIVNVFLKNYNDGKELYQTLGPSRV